jgi:hypothetical protein
MTATSGSARRRMKRANELHAISSEIDRYLTDWQERDPNLIVGGGTVGDLRIARTIADVFPDQTHAIARWRFTTGRRTRLTGQRKMDEKRHRARRDG